MLRIVYDPRGIAQPTFMSSLTCPRSSSICNTEQLEGDIGCVSFPKEALAPGASKFQRYA